MRPGRPSRLATHLGAGSLGGRRPHSRVFAPPPARAAAGERREEKGEGKERERRGKEGANGEVRKGQRSHLPHSPGRRGGRPPGGRCSRGKGVTHRRRRRHPHCHPPPPRCRAPSARLLLPPLPLSAVRSEGEGREAPPHPRGTRRRRAGTAAAGSRAGVGRGGVMGEVLSPAGSFRVPFFAPSRCSCPRGLHGREVSASTERRRRAWACGYPRGNWAASGWLPDVCKTGGHRRFRNTEQGAFGQVSLRK